MKRDIQETLIQWKRQLHPAPILLRGARQVSKSYVVEQFGRKQFDSMLVVNFKLQPELIVCFETLQQSDI